MTGRLDDHVAVVTGAGAGIGRGIALALAGEGSAVMLAGRTLARLEAVAAEIADAGGQARAVACDVSVRNDVQNAVVLTVEAFGPPDILVNNAQGGQSGRPGTDTLESVSDEKFLDLYRGGLLASLYGMQAVFPHMRERGGSIVNMASATGIMGDPGYAPYGTTKEAIRGLTKHAAREWGAHGIRVNTIAPAAWNQDMATFRDEAPKRWDAIMRQIPLGYFGDGFDDIGRAVVALVTDMRYLTGATLCLDGGRCILR